MLVPVSPSLRGATTTVQFSQWLARSDAGRFFDRPSSPSHSLPPLKDQLRRALSIASRIAVPFTRGKATRTVLMLTQRLDHHRGRGQQQIVVKHVTTVNADQAVITEGIVSGNAPRETPKLAAAGSDGPMQLIEPSQKEVGPVGGGTKSK
jgi:hypothetical protein